jgi:hypothetical protein
VKVTLGAGIAIIVALGALTLSHSPPLVVRVGTRALDIRPLAVTDVKICQGNEVLPAGVSAIRLALGAYFGSKVRVEASVGGKVLTRGTRGPGWTGNSVTVPVAPLKRSASPVKLCFEAAPNSELVYVVGTEASKREAAVWRGQSLGGRVGVEYLASGQGSWWSRVLAVARRMGLGHALTGTWVVLLVAALVASVGLLAVRLVLRELP